MSMSGTPGGGGSASSILLNLLAEHGGSGGHARRAAMPTSWVRCEDDPPPKPIRVPAPSCIDSGENCSSRQDVTKLQAFAQAVDEGMADDLKAIKKARQTFLRRSCDYRYAEFEAKGELLENTYGPKGPLVPGGSYLYELRKWADAAFMLHRSCNRGLGGCQSLLEYLKDHPEDDVAPGGMHGKAGSKIYNELRLACEVGKTRSPVPNDGPAWCSMDTGLCEQKSCKKWWRKVHMGKLEPWVDDRLEYDDLKEVCNWIEHSKPTSRELNKYQTKVQEETLKDKINFCKPKWIEGYCPKTKDAPRFGQCTMEDGKWCKHGRVFGDSDGGPSDLDDTARWEEPFKEKPVTVEGASMPPLLLLGRLPPPSELLKRDLEHAGRKVPASRYHSFL